MSNKINSVKEKLINDYIKKIDMAIDNYNSAIESDEEIFDLLIEIINVFEKDIPNLHDSLLIRTGTEIRDAARYGDTVWNVREYRPDLLQR